MARTVFGVALLSALAAAAPSPLAPLHTRSAELIPGKYIVKMRDDVMSIDAASILGGALLNNISTVYNGVFKGYAGAFDAASLALIRAQPNVEFVEQDSIMRISGTQTGADYGLAISSEKGKLSTASQNTYYYKDGAGSGVTVYVVDTGINTNHVDFGGRAQMVANYISGSANTDENGHGTHCSGTVGGATYGIAKSVQLRGVKVLDKNGSGATSGVISGINYAANACSGKCVISMSLGGSASSSVNSAVTNAVNKGVTTVVAAGNENQPACNDSPASAPSAITVGAIGNDYARASYSNYGSCVDVFAPGTNIKSDWIGSTTATNTISGTSMACPHVAGIAAYYLSFGASGPSQVLSQLQSLGDKNFVSNAGSGSPNLLANNGYFK